MQMILRPRMQMADLLMTLSYHNVDPSKFHGRLTKLLEEFNTGDTLFFQTSDNRLGKGRYSAKIHLVWRGRQLYEVKRIHPDGEVVDGEKPWFVSGTIKRPHGRRIKTNRHGEKPLPAAIREVAQETGVQLSPRDLTLLHGGQGIEMPLRESSVWIGLLAWEMQYHFLYDCSHLDEQPWPLGLTINESDGTTVVDEWGEQTTFPDGVYPGAHR